MSIPRTSTQRLRDELTVSSESDDPRRLDRLALIDAIERSSLLTPGMRDAVVAAFPSFTDEAVRALATSLQGEYEALQKDFGFVDAEAVHAATVEVRRVSEAAEHAMDTTDAEHSLQSE